MERARLDGKAVDRKSPDALLICDKQRNGDWEGHIGLWYDSNSQQFVASADDQPMSLYLHPEECQ